MAAEEVTEISPAGGRDRDPAEARPATAEPGAQAPSLTLDDEERALLEEAMRLTGVNDAAELVRLALRELVERQRFLNWVAQHERAEQGGNA